MGSGRVTGRCQLLERNEGALPCCRPQRHEGDRFLSAGKGEVTCCSEPTTPRPILDLHGSDFEKCPTDLANRLRPCSPLTQLSLVSPSGDSVVYYAHSGHDAAGKPNLTLFQLLAVHLREVAKGAGERAGK